MLVTLREWLDRRTGFRKLMAVMLIEHIPGGAKWRYVWGSCLAFVFTIQLVTGVLLMTAYSPGDSTAWSSVYYIQYQMDFGWLVRGLHHFGSQTMVVLLGLHMLQVVIAGAHLPPREINWWLGLMLMGTVLALSLTGYLLPWDQKGFWATRVATNIAGNLPLSGAFVQRIIVGGPAYGHHTLTRFYSLHVAILPPLLIVLTVLHLVVFRRHGVTVPKTAEGEGWFWPDQAFRDLLVSLVIFGVLLSVVLVGHGHATVSPEAAAQQGVYERWAHAGQRGLGANLDAPADPSSEYPPRPEWYFLFLFQLLKYFEGNLEIVGTVVLPNGVLLLLAILPLLGYGRMRGFGHVFGVLVVTALLAGAGCLTCLALADDTIDPTARALIQRIGLFLIPATAVVLLVVLAVLALLRPGQLRRIVYGAGVVLLTVLLVGSGGLLRAALKGQIPEAVKRSIDEHIPEAEKKPSPRVVEFHDKQEKADRAAARALELAGPGVPAGGAVSLLQRDPLTQGPKLFAQHCAGCHNHTPDATDKARKATASDLAGYGSREWVRDLLRDPGSERFFGRTPKLTAMTRWVQRTRKKAKGKAAAELDADFDLIAGWLATHPDRVPAKDAPAELVKGYKAFENHCIECHRFAGEGGGSTAGAPDFTGYGSAGWVRLMVMMPAAPSRYGSHNQMPAFRDLDGPTGEVNRQQMKALRELLLKELPDGAPEAKKMDIEHATQMAQLSAVQRELIIRWLLKDYRVVFGGDATSAAPAPQK